MTRAPLPLSLLAASIVLGALAPAQQPAQQPGPSVQTIRANSRIVIVDVVVTDKDQHPVRNLKQSDFTLLEKGEPQTLSHFEEHTALSAADAAKLPPAHKLPPGIFTNFSPAPASGALNILLLDELNTPLKDQMVVHQQIMKYLKSSRAGTSVAIFGLGTRLYLLQGFSSDPDVLRTLLDDTRPAASAGSETDAAANNPSRTALALRIKQFQEDQRRYQYVERIRYTIDALNQLGRYLSTLPGRKNLIWFSGSIPVDILPDADAARHFVVDSNLAAEFQDTINLMARAQVSVYPVDARGLEVAPIGSPSTSGPALGASGVKSPSNRPQAAVQQQQAFFGDNAGEHTVMQDMAHDTGGKAYINTNDLKGSVADAIDSGSNYYSLVYSPANKEWSGDYRKIEIQLAQKGYNLSYRRGYYADDPNSKTSSARRVSAAAPTAFDPIRTAMEAGGPDPTQIVFQAQILPESDANEDALAPGNEVGPNTHGPYRRYSVLLSADPSAINTPLAADGTHHIDVRFLALLYDSDGHLINSVGQHVLADMPPDRYAAMYKTGTRYRLEMSVPVKGEFFLRTGVADVSTQHVGAIEIPIDAVSKLKPRPAPAKNAP